MTLFLIYIDKYIEKVYRLFNFDIKSASELELASEFGSLELSGSVGSFGNKYSYLTPEFRSCLVLDDLFRSGKSSPSAHNSISNLNFY